MKANGKTAKEILTNLPIDRIEPFNKLHATFILVGCSISTTTTNIHHHEVQHTHWWLTTSHTMRYNIATSH
jgi:hypothetical protein